MYRRSVLCAWLVVSAGWSGASGDPTLAVPPPFTADQIREAWVPGLRLVFERTTPEGTVKERWTALAADDSGVEIEFARLDDAGGVAGSPGSSRSTWEGLRDHAKFPPGSAERTRVTRDTPLGRLDGWLYTVRDEPPGSVSEYFFATSLPGAPVHMRTVVGDVVTVELTQLERTSP